jgi:N-acetylmuramoyl-L-alanine amidase
MHFRPADWSGEPDAETAAILFALLEKYRPDALEPLLAEYGSPSDFSVGLQQRL